MFKNTKESRTTTVIISVLILVCGGFTQVLADRSSSMNANLGSDGRTFINVNCYANPNALLQPPYSKKFDPNTTFNIKGACNGPLYITADGIRLIGVDESAAIVLPGPPTDPSDGAIFGDGAHDLRIQDLLIDASAWGTGEIANGTDAAGILARNAFIRVINTRIVGGLWSINPFRNAIVRTQGLVELIDFVNSGISIGDQSLVTARGPVEIRSTVTDGGYMYAVDVYRSGVMDFRRGVKIELPEYNGFEPIAIAVYRQSHLRVRSSGTVNIQGPIMVNTLGSANIDGGYIGNDLDINGGSTVTLSSVTIDGGISAEDSSTITLNSVIIDGDIEVSTGSGLEMNWSTQNADRQDVEGTLAIAVNSNATLDSSSVQEIFAESASSFEIEGGEFEGAEIFQGAVASFIGAIARGDIRVFAPSTIVYQQEDGIGSLEWHTIHLCGNTSSFIDEDIRDTGFVVDDVVPDCLGNPYEDD